MKDVEVIKARNTLSPRARTNFEKRLRVAAYCRVSTDTEDQLNSYKSQVEYYTELIKSKPEWSLAGIYADEAITGTQVKKREDFQRLINDCMNGDVDMVITKSISRFARNTLDTLKYVRMLKDKGVAVFFEEENINTLTMDGELLLVILSSVAQQEVENISANVKKGLKMKMQRGELVGFQGCLGYDYNPEDKTLTVNEEEAAVVRYIFQRYTEGAGGSVIAKELENLGYKTKRGSPKWADSTVIGIIKNEKYKGDILLGKTFTVDPISKRRLYNFGEEDQFYIREHHEPIISEEVFEAAQEILRRRAKPRSLNVDGKREKFSRKYAFSCMIECGFCGGTLTRRSWHSSSQYNKAIWQCVVSTKKGKKFCPESKGVDERTIERAFVESYRLLCQNNKDVLDEFMKRTEEALSESNAGKRLAKAEKDIHALEVKKNKLVDMRLEDTIDKETYDRKYLDLSSQIEQLQKECESLQDAAETETTMRKRVAMFRQTLEQNEVLDTFDRHIFESIVEKVIVGGYDSDGNKDPYMIVFVYKTGFKNSVDGKNFKPLRKNSKENHSPAVLCSHASNEAESMCSDSSDDTRRTGGKPGVLARVPLHRGAAVVAAALGDNVQRLGLGLALLSQDPVVVAALDVAVLLDFREVRVRHAQLLTLINVRCAAHKVDSHRQHLGAFLPVGRVAAKAADRTGLVVVAPEQRIPAAVGLHPLLPGLEQFLHGEVIRLPQFPLLPVLVVDLQVVEIEAHRQLVIALSGVADAVFQRGGGHLPHRDHAVDAARGDQLLQVLVDVAAIGVEAAAVALVVILVKFGLGNDVDDVETETLDAFRLPEAQDVGHFLPHGGVLPVQVGLHDVVKMQIPFAKARHVFPRGAAEF